MSETVQVPASMRPRYRSPARLLLFIVLLLWIVATIVVVLERRAVLDWLRLRNYAPPAAVTALASATTMTPLATHDFYVNHPSIDSRQAFAGHCNFGREQSIVLGCYHSDQQGIYVLQVSDPRLQGVEEVTAAHETLHAAYDRLSSNERQHIDTLLQDFYDKQVTDPRIRATIDQYRKTEPNDVVNEMHSIFGTEIAQLPPELETYYRQYFTDRAKIVQFANAYSDEFTSRQQAVATYDSQLKQIKATIDANTAALSAEQAQLQALRSQLDSERSSDPAQYNQAVDVYNARVNAYNSKIAATRTLINQYNDIVDKRNALAFEEQQLVEALSGNSVPTTK